MSIEKDSYLNKSLEVAKETLDWLENRAVSASPINYTVGYEHLSGNYPEISQRLTSLDSQGEKLEQTLQNLYNEQLIGADIDQLDQFRQELYGILQEAISSTSQGQREVSAYQHKLNDSKTLLEKENGNLGLVRRVINDLVTETQRMDSNMRQMEQELHQATDEIGILKQQYEQVRNEVFTDPLTGVLNRRGLDSSLRSLLSKPGDSPSVAFLMIDLDNFKPFNDQYGHLVGDQVLCFVAKTLKNNVRGADLVARYGGDEFAVALPNTSARDARTVTQNILEALRKNRIKRRSTGEVLGTLTASVGIAVWEGNENIESLIERADKALYASKQAGRDRISC